MVELEIEKVVYGGDGLARLPGPEGGDGRREAVFVSGVVPGERVRAELGPRSRGRRTARLAEILQSSPDRVAPGCEYFGRCGGCQLQHIAYPRQVELKRQILAETLQRTGGIVWSGAIPSHTAEPWGYRNRVQLHALPGVGTGYRERESHRLVPVRQCPIASPEVNRDIAALAAEMPRRREEIEVTESGFRALGRDYRVGTGSFFQVNRFLTDALAAEVTGGQTGAGAVDLYSGVGLFALALADGFAQVDAVESHPGAVEDLRHNAASAVGADGRAKVRVHAADALAFLRCRAPEPVDLLVADPPRAGLGPELCAAILGCAPARLHLVSCDPSTLGRDLQALLAGGYAIEELHLFDLFPQTFHIETVVKLTRNQ